MPAIHCRHSVSRKRTPTDCLLALFARNLCAEGTRDTTKRSVHKRMEGKRRRDPIFRSVGWVLVYLM